MKNLGYVHSVAALGGAERMTEALVRGLDRNEFSPFLLCPETGAMPDLFAKLDIKSKHFSFLQPGWSTPIQTLRGRRLWIEAIEDNNLELLHTADLVCTRTLLLAAKSKNIPVICHIHFPFAKTYSDWVFKNLPKPSAFIFCSQELQDDVGAQLKSSCPTAKQYVIHNGVDTSYFTPTERNTNPTKRVGIVANLQKRKGHEDFLNMAKIVSDKFKDVHFDIIGGDILQEPREPYLQKFTSDLGLTDKVTFHGQVNNVRELITNLDVLVCASHQEAFPVSILEAMASGKAIVTTNVNGIPEAIEHQHTGLLVNPHQPEELAQAVLRLLADQTLTSRLAINARQKVEKHFSQKSYADAIQAVYQELL